MITRRQLLLHSAVFLAFFVATIAILQWRHVDPPLPRMLLIPGTLVQIEVPLGLLPIPDLATPAFGMDGGHVAWIDAAAADDLATIFTGTPPPAWPEPLPYDVAARDPRVLLHRDAAAAMDHTRFHGMLAVELDPVAESVRIR